MADDFYVYKINTSDKRPGNSKLCCRGDGTGMREDVMDCGSERNVRFEGVC